MLAWWASVRVGDARLRTIVLRDGQGVLGIAPMFAQVGKLGLTEYRLLAAGFSHRIGVVCRPGSTSEVSAPLAEALGNLQPRPSSVVWEGIDVHDEWPVRTARGFRGAGGVALRRDLVMGAPTVQLAGCSFDDWFGGMSRSFRSNVRRQRRLLARAGGRVRRSASASELETDLPIFARLHTARWQPRGGSHLLNDRHVAMLRQAGTELLPADRFRLYVVELDEQPIAASLFLAAGGHVAFWNSGMDDAYASLSPGRLAMVKAIEEICERNERRLDLGGGADSYKMRLANGNEPVVWRTAFPRNLRYPLTRTQLLPKHLRYHVRAVARRLPLRHRRRLKRLLHLG